MTDVYVLDAIRTPFGRYGGALAGVRPDDLAAGVLRALQARNDLDPSTVDEVTLGDANGAGEDNRNVARMAALLAGWPTSVPGNTVNRLCGSGLDAVMQASRAIQVGDASLVVAGGVESMTRSPLVMPKPEKAFPAGNQTLYNTALGWRMVNPAMPAQWTISLGESTELLAERYGIGRDEQDAFAARSHVNAAKAWDEGFYDDLVVPVDGVDLARDEGIRPDSSPEKLAQAQARLPQGERHRHGGQRLPAERRRLGAAARRPGGGEPARQGAAGPDRRPRRRRASTRTSSASARSRAAEIALERAGIGWDDLAAVELNEAFAAQSLACLR